MNLSIKQARSIRAIAEIGTGVSINRRTAQALERRGLATISGDAMMASGVTMRLTNEGRQVAIMLWEEYDRDFQAKRDQPSHIAHAVLAKLRTETI